MSKTRFTQWVVLACIGTLAGCTSGEGGTAGNTELNVMIPTGGGSTAPADFDIQIVEYTINCDAPDPTAAGLGVDSINPGVAFNPDVTINGVLEVLDTASSAVDTQDFGVNLDEVYVWQGFMDIPKDAICTVQLRARDFDREVICTATEDFDTNTVAVGGTVKVNVLMYCDISFQAPVAMLDLDGDFSFNISNFCPDLFILNCIDTDLDIRDIPGAGTVAATACQVRARDGDSQCGDSCDPQTCVEDTEGLTCTAANGNLRCSDDLTVQCANQGDCDDAGAGTCGDATLLTTVACAPPSFRCAAPPLFGVAFGTPCNPVAADFGNSDCGWPPPGTDLGGGNIAPAVCAPGAAMDCNGIPNDPSGGTEPPFDTSCTYTGDVLGNIGGLAPAPLQPGPGGFFIQCVLADDDGNPLTPEVPLDPGATVTCQATTTDGDEDCDKTKIVQVTCPGLTPCQDFGGDAACQAASSTVCQAGTCNDSTCDGTAAECCDYAAVPDSAAVDCSSECATGADCELSPGLCEGGVCTSQDCNAVGCPDTGNECTTNVCEAGGSCTLTTLTGDLCAGDTGVCQSDNSCLDNCAAQGCVAGALDCDACVDTGGENPCTDNVCTSGTGAGAFTCANPPNDGNSCNSCASGICICEAGGCIEGCNVPVPQDVNGIPMACRNSFDIKAVSTFPIDFRNITPDDCILSGQTFNTAIDPVLALDVLFLQAAADTLCGLGTALTAADVTIAQVAVDAVAGATCTEQISAADTDPPIFIDLDATVTGECGVDGEVTINSGTQLALPLLTLPCTAGATGSEVQICSVGTVPLEANIDLGTPATQTFLKVSVGGGNITVAFQCNTSSTTNPLPGVEVGCSSPNAFGGNCAADVGVGDTGQTPFPTSDCDLTGGPPDPPQDCGSGPGSCFGTCKTVPIAVDPGTVCPTFTVQ